MPSSLLPSAARAGDVAPPSTVRRTVLDSGLVVVTESVPHARTAAFGLFGLSGSRDEAEGRGGLAHFLEHFVFRGTAAAPGRPARSALDIARETDALGGDIDAWTDREGTGYSMEVAAELLPRAIDLVADLVARPALPADDLERERGVVLEELRGLEDSPEEVVFDASARLDWGEHSLGRPVAGTLASVEAFTIDDVVEAWRATHVPRNLLACAAGRLEHDEVVRRVELACRGLDELDPPRGRRAPEPRRGVHVERRDHLEQAHLVLSLAGLPLGDADEAVLDVLSQALCGGLSSRLWQRIREREGLAYDLTISDVSFRDVGRLALHVACSPDRVERALGLAAEELSDVASRGLAADELDLSKEALRSSLVLGLESPSARMGELAHWQVVEGRHLPLSEQLARVDAVGPSDVARVAAKLLCDPRRTLALLGPEDTPRVSLDTLFPA